MTSKWFTCRVYNTDTNTERNTHVIARNRSHAIEKATRLLPNNEMVIACWEQGDEKERARQLR